MIGIPYSGTNTGSNPNLRLITFTPDTLEGPIAVAGAQQIFYNNLLNHKVEWRIEPIGKIERVSIGFYTFNYVDRELGSNKLIPLITTQGPAFYKSTSFKGVFTTSEFSNMYVIVDANVSVKLKISYVVPEYIDVPCLKELFIPYKYLVGCGEVAATEQLINQQTLATLIRPADKYIDLSQRMIKYLTDKAVTVTIFNPPSLSLRSLQASEIVYSGVPFRVIGSSVVSDTETIIYEMYTEGSSLSTQKGQAFSINQETSDGFNASLGAEIALPEDQDIASSKFIGQFGSYSGEHFGIEGRAGVGLSVFPGSTNEYFDGGEFKGLNNITYRLTEIRTYNKGEGKEGKPAGILSTLAITYS